MLRVTTILGYVSDAAMAEQLHALSHANQVETIFLDRADAKRHRLRTMTDRGAEVAIALARSESLSDGAVLYLAEDRAIVVRMKDEQWLRFAPADVAAALALGYAAGNLHWRVRFTDGILEVAREGPEETYLDRLRPLLNDGRVRSISHDRSA